jgi:hypothetical protein
LITVSTPQIAVIGIHNYIQNYGGPNSAWYCGVAAEPRQRLFVDHNVNQALDSWIYRDCGSDAMARAVEQYFLVRGCKGGPGGGDRTTRFVYAYKITMTTVE